MSQEISDMSRAKARMLLKHVFFASVLLSTKVVEDKGCPTAYTDMTMIGYNPDFIASLRDPELVLFVLAHEVLHIILKHGLRVGSRNHQRWNIAADHAVNLMLKEAGFKLWSKCYADPMYTGMSAEKIYDLLDEDAGGEGTDGGGMPGDLTYPGNMDPEERAVLDRKIDQMVAAAASMARMAGKMTAGLERLVEGVLNPPLPWQQLLREYLVQGYKDEESWSHRNRRVAHVYLPSSVGVTMGEVVLIGDTSGSITNRVFAQVGAEIAEIMELLKPERIRVVWADAAVAGEEVFERHDPVELHPKGGGGTDMRVPLQYIEQYEPVMAILITDGYTPWPRGEPPYPLIVCCTTDAECPVGQVVRMTGL